LPRITRCQRPWRETKPRRLIACSFGPSRNQVVPDLLGRSLRPISRCFSQSGERIKVPQERRTFTPWLRVLFRHDWVVYSKPPFGGPEHVLRYLGAYTHRVAIANSLLVALANGHVTFRCRDSAHGNKKRLMTLPIEEFLRRFLLHLLPRGLMRIRNFGLGPRAGVLSGTVIDKVTGKAIVSRHALHFIVKKASNPEDSILFGGPAKFRWLIPPAVEITLEVTAGGYKPWFYTDASNPSRPLPLRLESGEQKSLDIELEPDATQSTMER
jgi:hypothetical protein